jgi:hypothetical protein
VLAESELKCLLPWLLCCKIRNLLFKALTSVLLIRVRFLYDITITIMSLILDHSRLLHAFSISPTACWTNFATSLSTLPASLQNRDFQNSHRSRQRPGSPRYKGPTRFITGLSFIGPPSRASLYSSIPLLIIHRLATDTCQLVSSREGSPSSKALRS